MSNRRHRITAVNLDGTTWIASCSHCGQIGQGTDTYISYVIAIHQANAAAGNLR